MDHYREIKNTLAWHNEGKFEVELINGIINKLNFCEPGKGPDDSGHCLTSTNYKFLQTVYSCLGDLFVFIEEENKRLGYRYSRDEEFVHRAHQQNEENEYPMLGETKMRPLNDFSEDDLITSSEENEMIRDAG